MRKYLLICRDKFSLYALENEDGSCEIAELLDRSNARNKDDATARVSMVKKLERLSMGQLPESPVHHMIEDGIRQISSDKYRLMYFFDSGRLIICTHSFVKKGDKTPKREIEKAKRHREAYLRAQKNKTLRLEG